MTAGNGGGTTGRRGNTATGYRQGGPVTVNFGGPYNGTVVCAIPVGS